MADNNETTDSQPAALLSGIQEQGLGKPLAMSIVFHIILVGVFSIGYISLCMKYKTLDVKDAQKAEQDQIAQTELENKRKAMADKAAKEDDAGKTAKAPDKSGDEKKVPKVIKETQEVIKDKPKKPSSLDSFDDDL